MALAISRNSRKVVVYTKGLRTLCYSICKFSSQDNSKPKSIEFHFEDNDDERLNSGVVWPDKRLGVFGPKDERLPLPGNVGIADNFRRQKQVYGNLEKISLSLKNNSATSDLLIHTLPSQRHESVLFQVLQKEEETLTQELEEELLLNIKKFPEAGEMLECVAQECPKLIRKEFSDLFPHRDISAGTFTVITLSQKTTNDMSMWSEEVDEEREQLAEFFIAAAENICKILKDAGYWADFIDPTSGRPFLGDHTSAVLSETDERFQHFGFSIEDLGCCKVISHHIWGTQIFVGSLFTNVPVNNSVLKEILLKYTTYRDEDV